MARRKNATEIEVEVIQSTDTQVAELERLVMDLSEKEFAQVAEKIEWYLSLLNPQQAEILRARAMGTGYAALAKRLELSVSTVKNMEKQAQKLIARVMMVEHRMMKSGKGSGGS